MPTTLNPSDTDPNITLSNGNLTVTGTASTTGLARSTTSKASGKWYVEVTLNSNSSGAETLGICNSSASNLVWCGGDGVNGGNTFDSVGYQAGTGDAFIGAQAGWIWATIATTHTVGLLIDLTGAPTVAWQITDNGGAPFASHNFTPGQGVGTGPFFIALSPSSNTGDQMTVNFGPNFASSIPVGYSSWDAATPANTTERSLPTLLMGLGIAAVGVQLLLEKNPAQSRRKILMPWDWR